MAEYVIDELGRVLKVRDVTYEEDDRISCDQFVSFSYVKYNRTVSHTVALLEYFYVEVEHEYVYSLLVYCKKEGRVVSISAARDEITLLEDQGAARAMWELITGS